MKFNIKKLSIALSLICASTASYAHQLGDDLSSNSDDMWEVSRKLLTDDSKSELDKWRAIIPTGASIVGAELANDMSSSKKSKADLLASIRDQFLNQQAVNTPGFIEELMSLENKLRTSETALMLSTVFTLLDRPEESEEYEGISKERASKEEVDSKKKNADIAEKLQDQFTRDTVKEYIKEMHHLLPDEYLAEKWSDVKPYSAS